MASPFFFLAPSGFRCPPNSKFMVLKLVGLLAFRVYLDTGEAIPPLLDSGIIPGDSCQASLRLSDINKVQAGNLCFHIFLHKQRADLSVVSRVKFYPRATNHKMSAGGTAEEGKEENKVISCLFNRTQELQGTILRHLSVEPHSRFAAVVVAELRTFSK